LEVTVVEAVSVVLCPAQSVEFVVVIVGAGITLTTELAVVDWPFAVAVQV
jgi:hypothetical protein